MVDTKIAPGRSRMAMVLKAIKERGEPPFGDVLEVIDALEGPDLTGFDICLAIPRLVRAGRIRYALDGIRMVTCEDGTPPATVVSHPVDKLDDLKGGWRWWIRRSRRAVVG